MSRMHFKKTNRNGHLICLNLYKYVYLLYLRWFVSLYQCIMHCTCHL